MKKIIEASGNKIDNFWIGLFAKCLQNVNVNSLFGGASAGPTG